MITHTHAETETSASSLRPLAILVFTTKIVVAGFLVSQAALVPASPVAQVYGLSR
ncbi:MULTISPECIES: hypothetical protein [Rhizobium]|uniref:hypothetical protein n=1 Tax=Rhizobium TaxID=379 RepID=UPI000FEF5BB9|nr:MULTISPECIES: hypothetical protein [Rhizobium]RKE84191.1 hypothetical protein DFO46_0953 [Rhizobium sp. AG855]